MGWLYNYTLNNQCSSLALSRLEQKKIRMWRSENSCTLFSFQNTSISVNCCLRHRTLMKSVSLNTGVWIKSSRQHNIVTNSRKDTAWQCFFQCIRKYTHSARNNDSPESGSIFGGVVTLLLGLLGIPVLFYSRVFRNIHVITFNTFKRDAALPINLIQRCYLGVFWV